MEAETTYRRFTLKFKVSIGIFIAFLSLIAITSSIFLYRSVQEEARLKDMITGYQAKIGNQTETNTRLVTYTNHLLMLLESAKQEAN
jgi:hypothetical protein